MILPAWRFFTHPAAKAGAVFAALVFAYYVITAFVELLTLLTPQTAEIAGRPIQLSRQLSLFNLVSPLSYAFIILAFALMVELGMRIARRAPAALRAGHPGQTSDLTGRMKLMTAPSGVIIGAGLVIVAAFVIDCALFFVFPQNDDFIIGWGPVFEVSREVGMLDTGLLLIVLGVIIAYLARIAARLQVLAGGAEAEL
ncbi:hypothetical protein F1654_02680 [Alkalicaulis satelles]|uniref:Uncharacterized protein n=1 Tax=Alkalicaulis satelles TaxID=2609175 RepID=A0A5M6ZRL1_9PROT|nr:hypothetical protein [Alkalicaulis satelles]KAA5804921.1 hypothetical protein F1654_02680 [Alkalicaulis satelles]